MASAAPFLRYRPYLGYRAAQVLAYIQARIAEDGREPSYAMIRDDLGFSSKAEVSRVVAGLERRKLVKRTGNGWARRGVRRLRLVAVNR